MGRKGRMVGDGQKGTEKVDAELPVRKRFRRVRDPAWSIDGTAHDPSTSAIVGVRLEGPRRMR